MSGLPALSGKWIDFYLWGPTPSGRTNIWHVRRKGGGLLGEIKWYGRWRCYAFFPVPATLYEKDCLRDIATFCEDRTKEKRAE